MSQQHKNILTKGNAAIMNGKHEEFLDLLTDDSKWIFPGDKILEGKDAIRKWLNESYPEPPSVIVDHMIAEDDYLVAVGQVTVKDKSGNSTKYHYSDLWRFRDNKIWELKGFVIKANEQEPEERSKP